MSYNDPALTTFPGPKAKTGPYHSSYVRPGRAGSCLTWAGECGAHAPAPPENLAPAEYPYRARCVSALLDDATRH